MMDLLRDIFDEFARHTLEASNTGLFVRLLVVLGLIGLTFFIGVYAGRQW